MRDLLQNRLAELSLASLGCWLVATSLPSRGRWDLNEPIAAADRIFGSGPLYTAGDADGFLPSTPYFPGVTFIAYVTRLIVGTRLQEEALLVLACLLIIG